MPTFNLQQKKDRYYLVAYDPNRHPTRKWVPLDTSDKAVARQRLTAWERDTALGVRDPWAKRAAGPREGVTVPEAAERFLKDRQHLRPKTLQTYGEVLRLFGRSLPPTLLLRQVEARHIQAFLDRKRPGERALSQTSRRTYFTHLRAFLNWAEKGGLLPKGENPLVGFTPPKNPKNPAAFLQPEDVERLVRSITEADSQAGQPGRRHWLADIVLFAVGTGLRRGEIVNLRWQHVHLEGADPFVQVVSGDGFATKSGHGRTVPLATDALAVIERRCETRAKADPADFVFPGEKGGKLNGNRLSAMFRASVREAKLPKTIHFHSLRHTCASWLAMRGVSLYLVANILGNTPEVAQRYAHLAPGAAHDAMRTALEAVSSSPKAKRPRRRISARQRS